MDTRRILLLTESPNLERCLYSRALLSLTFVSAYFLLTSKSLFIFLGFYPEDWAITVRKYDLYTNKKIVGALKNLSPDIDYAIKPYLLSFPKIESQTLKVLNKKNALGPGSHDVSLKNPGNQSSSVGSYRKAVH